MMKCDRCGATSSEHEDPGAWERLALKSSETWRDLCPHCTMALNAWWKHPAAGEPKEAADDNAA